MSNPVVDLIGEDGDRGERTGRIVPIYPQSEKAQLSTWELSAWIDEALRRCAERGVADPVPGELLRRNGLTGRGAALNGIHHPETLAEKDEARRRLAFDELLRVQLVLVMRKRALEREARGVVHVSDGRLVERFYESLSFPLTAAQRRTIAEIAADLWSPHPMHRLLQGDVGAGKTIVALLAAIVAMENGLQAAFMAPTEILATQHYSNIARLLASSRFRVDLLTGSTPGLQKHTLLAHLERGTTHLVVGTHALVQERIAFHNLGLVVIDEQHRFGVAQRAALRAKGLRPDVLLMTATPIPRTLALTDYSELDVSKITDLPPGRKPVRTWVKPESRRDEIYQLVREQLDAGRQAYIIYPLVEESEKIDLRSATEMADHLQSEVFPAYRVALLHGRMKQDVKDRVMQSFAMGQVHILVSTTVIEVGVDVANASVMIVEHAERFGLSQLHQLRGRVGRGQWESHCILLYQAPWTDDARERLKAMASTSDGFVIAERDLELRGPGDFFGTRQSGLPRLRTGDLVRDRDVMEEAHREARQLVEQGALPAELSRFVQERWQDQFGLIEVG
jgi:ATP-dependent DNA helicase RecG